MSGLWHNADDNQPGWIKKYGATTWASMTNIQLNRYDYNNTDWSNWITYLRSIRTTNPINIQFTNLNDPNNFGSFQVPAIDNVFYNGTWFMFTGIQFMAGNGSWVSDALYNLTFIVQGSTGPTGPGADQLLNTTSDVSFNSIHVTNDVNIYGRLFTNYPDETIPISAIIGATGINGQTGSTGPTGPQGPQGPQGNCCSTVKYSIVNYDGDNNTPELNPVSQYIFIAGNNKLTLPNPIPSWKGVEVNARIIDDAIISNGYINVSTSTNTIIPSGLGISDSTNNLTVTSLSATFICNGTYWVQFPWINIWLDNNR